MMGDRLSGQGALFYEFSMERFVPDDHILRSVVTVPALRRSPSAAV